MVEPFEGIVVTPARTSFESSAGASEGIIVARAAPMAGHPC
jgi:hypothetical protein